MSDRVLVEVENHIALITVNDPERRNAVTAEISAGLRTAVDAAEANDGNSPGDSLWRANAPGGSWRAATVSSACGSAPTCTAVR